MEMDFDESTTFDDLFANRLEGVTGFVILMKNEKHAGKAVGDKKSFVGVAKSFLAGFTGFREFERATAGF